jgi:GNAT superfamily N-acetyltransferase
MAAADCGAVAALVSEVFGIVRGAEQVRAKYCAQPGTCGLSTVLEDGGRIVGFHGHVPQCWNVGGRRVTAVMGADLAVLPAYRRLEHFLDMAEESGRNLLARGVAFLWGVPLGEVRELNQEILDFQSLGPVPRWVCPIRLGRCLAAKRAPGRLKRMLPLLLRPADLRLLRHRFTPRQNLHLREAGRFDERLSTFSSGREQHFAVSLVRDLDAWNERFAAPAHPDYLRVLAEDSRDGSLRGLMVLAAATDSGDGLRRGRVLEFAIRDGRDAAAGPALLARALDEARRRGWDVLDGWLSPGDPLAALFRRFGFRCAGKAHRDIQVKAFPSSLPDFSLPLAPAAWHWSIGHGDEL